jgi:hypothetical protein
MANKETRKTGLMVSVCLLAIVSTAVGRTIYVDDDAIGANDGSSWADAYNFLKDALVDANSADKPVEVRVARGIYAPDSNSAVPDGTGDREATFQLINGATIKGGYAGVGVPHPTPRDWVAPDPNDRDIVAYVTILSGDIRTPGKIEDNSHHVVTASWTDTAAVLDGVTIANGYDKRWDWEWGRGAGMLIVGGSPTLVGCTFTANEAIAGAGVYNSGSIPTLTNCTFVDNRATDLSGGPGWQWPSDGVSGGGMYNDNSSPIMTNCTFRANEADKGGGMYNSRSNPALTNCLFTENRTKRHGGNRRGAAMFNNASSPTLSGCTFSDNVSWNGGGGMSNHESSNPVLRDCVFAANRALGGGGMDNNKSAPTLANCTFTENYVAGWGGGMANAMSSPIVTRCRFVGNSSGYRGGAIQNGGSSDPLVTSCTFLANSAYEGAAINSSASRPTLAACTVSGNRAVNSGAAVHCFNNSNPRLLNCIVWANHAGDGPSMYVENGSTIWAGYSDIQGDWPGEGNMDVDPCFVEPGYWDPNGTPEDANDDFWVDGDYHLKSQAGRYDPNGQRWVRDAVTSPCVDAGDPGSPIRSEPFPNGGIINMGAYGGTVEASKSYFGKAPCETIVAGDINGDCAVNFKDFTFLALHWLMDNSP